MANILEWMFGSPDKLTKIPTGTPEQQALHGGVIQNAMNMAQPGGGYDLANQYYNNFLGPNEGQAYNQFAAPYLQQFEEQMLPMIAERFAGSGALSSSGFGQALGGASAGLQAQLAQLFAQLQGQAAQSQYGQYNQQTQTGLNYQPFAYNKQQGSTGLFAPFLGAIGTAAAGPIGGALGGLAASGINSMFKRSGGGIT